MKGSRRTRGFALGVLGLALGASLLLAGELAARERRHRHTVLNTAAREVASHLTTKLRRLFERLAAGAALLESPGLTVTDETWSAFLFALRSDGRSDRLPFIGYLERVTAADLDNYLSTVRAAGHPDFKVHYFGEAPAVPPGDHYLMRRCEPSGPDTPSLGLDVGSNPVRRRAIERARDMGAVTLTPPIALIAFRSGEVGFVLSLPVYHPGTPQATVEQRRAAFQGSLGSPIALSFLLEDLRPGALRLAAYEVVDLGGPGQKETRLASGGSAPVQRTDEMGVHTLRVANRTWVIRTRPTPAFAAAHSFSNSRKVLLGAGLVSLLLGLLCHGLLAAQLRHEKRRRVSLHQFELAVRGAGLAPYQCTVATGRIEWKAPPGDLARLFAGEPPGTIQTFTALLQEPDRTERQRVLVGQFARPGPFDTTHRLRLPNGEERILHNRGTALAGPDGTPESVFGIVWDGTARQREAQALLQSETRYHTLFESCLDAVLLLDEHLAILECNRASIEIFGASGREDLVGRCPVTDLSPPEQPSGLPSPRAFEPIARVLQRSQSQRFLWTQRRLDTGGDFPAEISVSLLDLDGHPIFLGTVRDMSAVVARARNIAEHRDRLQTLSAALFDAEHAERRRVAGGLHDDICQSLVLSRLRLQSVRGLRDPDARREACGGLLALLQRLRATCDSLAFDLSSPRLEREGLASALRELCEHTAREPGLDCAFTEAGAGALLPADRGVFLYHAARELLANVRRHAAATAARVTLRTRGGRVTLAVADNGRGVPRHEGTGLTPDGGFGLFSIREHAGAMGGRLRIRSRPGAGTLVVLRVPVSG